MTESIKEKLRRILIETAQPFIPEGTLPAFDIERPKVKEHGELSTNLAMILARPTKKNPKTLAQEIVSTLKDPEGLIEKATVAGAGFINFVLKRTAWQESLRKIVAAGDAFGKSKAQDERKAVVEFVSANPTGPVHIGNARGGPLGDVIASLLSSVGYNVTREFYVNDVGGQVDKLGKSILHALLYKPGLQTVTIYADPKNSQILKGVVSESEKIDYQGDYVDELARKASEQLVGKVPRDIGQATELLGKFGMGEMLKEIRQDCDDMGIHFDQWVSEKSILATETVPVLKALQEKGVTLEKEGATWLATNDEFLKDRECVLVRSDGRPTYFGNDVAYHVQKFERGFDRLINVWGSNHHGHVPRIQAAVKSLGYDPDKIETVLYQYVRVKRGEEAVKMSKRAGNFVTAREVLDEVGRDAFRFLLLMRAADSHLDFDLDLAKRQTADNPVYYVQYAHARLCSIERKAEEAKIAPAAEDVNLALLDLPEEIEMIRMLQEYPEEVERAATRLEPHRIPFYLLELVRVFQAYYTKAKEDPRYRVLSGTVDTSRAKLYLCGALKLTISQGLKLLGVSAPEVMTSDG